MNSYRAVRAGTLGRVFGGFALVASLGLAGCSDVDDALFGAGDEADTAQATPGTLPVPASSQQQAQSVQPAPAVPPSDEDNAPPPQAVAAAPVAAPPAYVAPAAVAPMHVEAGANTGTAVSSTVANLRAQLTALEERVASNAQQQAGLHGQAAATATAYHESKARITARLQLGTTRGNPELVAEWNTAQSALDQLTVDINAFNALGNAVAKDSSEARALFDQIAATFNVSGAVDEDHRQLTVLEDETTQTTIRIDRLLKTISEDVQRQTAYAGNERANLTTLASAIKNGELYGAEFSAPALSSSAMAGGAPLVVIRFDRANVDYQQMLYAALNQALQTRPGAAFSVVAVSPTRGTVAAVQSAQTAAKRHAQEVMRSITGMGVPASRLAVASSTDPNASSSEIRVFVR